MLGIIVQLIISWILLKLIEKKDLSVLGLTPNGQRLKHFGAGFLIAALFVAAYWIAVSLITRNSYKLNPGYSLRDFFIATWYVVKSVAFEELIFRGAVLYILIHRLGATKALLISAACFGIYHWFSYGILGQPVMMIFIFFITGIMGYMYALAFQKIKSLYLPFAIHFGYNFTTMIIFSGNKAIGMQLLTKTIEGDAQYNNYATWILMAAISAIGFPLVTYLFLRTINSETKSQ